MFQPKCYYKNSFLKGVYVYVNYTKGPVANVTWYRFDDNDKKIVSMNEESWLAYNNEWEKINDINERIYKTWRPG